MFNNIRTRTQFVVTVLFVYYYLISTYHTGVSESCDYNMSVSLLPSLNIGKVRKYLGKEATRAVIYALVTSRLDKLNGLLYGLPACQVDKPQRVQTTAVRIVTRTRVRDHVTCLPPPTTDSGPIFGLRRFYSFYVLFVVCFVFCLVYLHGSVFNFNTF